MRRSLILLLAVLLSVNSAGALTADQWKSDLSVLHQAIAAHPNPFRKTSKEQFETKAKALADGLGQMSDAQVVAGMAELVALLGDGHTRLLIPVAENAQLFPRHRKSDPPKIQVFGSFPIRLTATADGFVVTRTSKEHQDLLGGLVVAVAGKPITQVASAIRPMVYGDSEQQRDYLLPRFLVIPELLVAANIARDSAKVSWTIRQADGKELSRELAAIGDQAID